MLQVFPILSETGVKVERFVPRDRYDPSTVSPSSTRVLGQSLLPGSILALFSDVAALSIIARSIETSLPITALSPIIVDFMEQFSSEDCVLERDSGVEARP